MDFTDPTKAITPTLDGPVLAVLVRAGRPMTVGEIAEQASRGSEIGIRKCLARLVDQGIVRAVEMGRNRVHELNRQHVAANAAVALEGIRYEFLSRLRKTLAVWDPAPMDARLFGSAARGDGGPGSDIDLLLVRRPKRGEQIPKQRKSQTTGLIGLLIEYANQMGANSNVMMMSAQQEEQWQNQVDQLRAQVQVWTGNQLQVVDLSIYEITDKRESGSELIANIDREGIALIEKPSFSLSPITTPALK